MKRRAAIRLAGSGSGRRLLLLWGEPLFRGDAAGLTHGALGPLADRGKGPQAQGEEPVFALLRDRVSRPAILGGSAHAGPAPSPRLLTTPSRGRPGPRSRRGEAPRSGGGGGARDGGPVWSAAGRVPPRLSPPLAARIPGGGAHPWSRGTSGTRGRGRR